MVGATGAREPVLAVGKDSDELEELQFTLGQGPGVDAAAGAGVVLVPDLAAGPALRRWPMFAPAATERGVRGLFAFPVAAGAVRIGVLDVYRRDPGALGATHLTTALAFADAVLVMVLDQRGAVRGGTDPEGAMLPERRAEVHQAAGMVSVQLGVQVSEALVRLRAYAFVHERRLADVAAAVLARRLRFGPDRRGMDETEWGDEMMDAPPNSDPDHPESGA